MCRRDALTCELSGLRDDGADQGETSAATRRALLDAAGALLDAGGPDAVTLREVGARAGVSRSAPYRHFAEKESLLRAVAAEAWREVGDTLEAFVPNANGSPEQSLRLALLGLVRMGSDRPHLYRLMFTTPVADPTALARAAEHAQDLFLSIMSAVVGPHRVKQCGALLLASVHGITGLELSGHLAGDKWQSDAEDLVELLISLLPRAA